MLQRCKIWVYLKIYRNLKPFFKISPPPPRVPAKAFACICVTIIYTLYGSLLTFFKIMLLKNKPPRTTICWSSSGFKPFAKGYWQTTKLSTGMQRVITGKYFSAQYIVLYRDRHAYVYHKYSDTLDTFNMLCPCFLFENH